MELLVFGIDGGDLEIMKTFDMPFFKSLLDKNSSILLEEDLFNRGWAEILTGKEGKETHGFYMAPKLDGTHKFATSFKMKDLEEVDSVKPIWTMLEEKGVSYCIMNVPTTTPVPKTKNGVVIGSAGGGLNKIEGIPEMLVSDETTRRYLEDQGYIVDIRIPNHEISSTEVLFEQLVEMEKMRTKCFVDICKNNNSSFGFLVDRGTTIVQYLARNEIEAYQDNKKNGKDPYKRWAASYLEKHYKTVDDNIKLMVEELKPKNIIITADHNHVPHKYQASVTPFLRENNWLVKEKKFTLVSTIKKVLKKLGLLSYANKMKKNVTTLSKMNLSGYDMHKSVALGSHFLPGIYINDSERFGGPVKGEEDIRKWVDLICTKFNDIDNSIKRGMVAKPYRSLHSGYSFSHCLPDIILENFEGMHFESDGKSLTWKNEDYFREIPKSLQYVNRSEFTGDKGKNPVFVISNNLTNYIDSKDDNKLTLVYKITERYFQTQDA